MTRPPPRSTLFPYTTLFRSMKNSAVQGVAATERFATQLSDDGVNDSADAPVTPSTPAPGSDNLSGLQWEDRKSTRLNSSHTVISYAVFCLKKKNISCAEITL